MFLMARIPHKAVGPIYIRRDIPRHVKKPRQPVEETRVLITGVTFDAGKYQDELLGWRNFLALKHSYVLIASQEISHQNSFS